MANKPKGKTIAFPAADGVEDIEFTPLTKRSRTSGAMVERPSIRHRQIQRPQSPRRVTTSASTSCSDVSANDYDGLVLRGSPLIFADLFSGSVGPQER
jgi:hypothetical protein